MLRPIESEFSIAQARGIVKDQFKPKAWIYWADFLGSLVIGSACFGLVRRGYLISPEHAVLVGAVCYLVSVVLYYRASLFIHEITHLRDNTFRGFRIAWNLLCGIPFLMPSFMYYTHVDHHMRKHFGTDHDGEYLPLATTGPGKILVYLCQPFLIPILAVVRFLILAPLGWISPAFRRWLHVRASSLVMDPSYVRPLPSRKSLQVFRLQELGCFVVCAGSAALYFSGKMPKGFLPHAYLTGVGILCLNHLRTLGAHRYTNAGGEMTFVDQLLDSVNYPQFSLLHEIAMPVGLRYHALHHLFPTLPYHAMPAAHRMLMEKLPASSPYRRTNSTGLRESLGQLWRVSRSAAARQPQMLGPDFERTPARLNSSECHA